MNEITRILGGKSLLRSEMESYFDFMEVSSRGVSKRSLTKLAEYLDLSIRHMATLAGVSERTLQRYAADDLFDRSVSEQILQVAEVAARGVGVFEDRERLLGWLKQPSKALGGAIPLELVRSRFGAGIVLQEIGRVEHGVVS